MSVLQQSVLSLDVFVQQTFLPSVIGSTAAYAASGPVFSTAACPVLPLEVSVLKQPVLLLHVSVLKQPKLPLHVLQQTRAASERVCPLQQPMLSLDVGLFYGSLCSSWTRLAYISLCCPCSTQPQANMGLLRSNSVKFQPLCTCI
jgi:hypothetical protein